MDYSVFPGVVLNLAKQLKTSYLATQIYSLCKTENCTVTKQFTCCFGLLVAMLAQTDQSRSETWPWSWTKSLNHCHVFLQFNMSQQVFPIISLPQLNWLIKLFIFPLLCPSFSFASLFLGSQMAYNKTHGFHLINTEKTLSLGYDKLLWHNFTPPLGFIT